MRKSSLNAPKRISQPPSLSREDAQISANDFRLRDGIRFHPIPCGGSGENRYYRLGLENANDNIVGLDALEDRLLTAGLNLRVSAVENILNTLLDILPAYIAETGNAVRIGNLVTLKPYVTGTLAHANDAADPEKNHLEIRATVAPALRYALSRAPLVNVNRASDGIAHIAGGPDGKDCEIDTGHETLVTGHGIYLPVQTFDASDAKGRAWLETLEGEKVGRFDVTVSGESLLHLWLHLDAADSPRDCRLVIETYGTSAAAESATAPLLSYRRKVKLVG
jgi:hypothetical protein